MAPNVKDVSQGEEVAILKEDLKEKLYLKSPSHSQLVLVWRNVLLFVYLHVGALIGVYHALFCAKLLTVMLVPLMAAMSVIIGITAGAHRLWAHKTFKGTLTMRIIAMLFNCIAVQNDIYEWARDHRAHHKFTETDADPHNSNRGFFFSHMGWLIVRKQPDVRTIGGRVDMSDVAADPVVQFQRRNYIPLLLIMNFASSIALPHYGFGDNLFSSFYVAGLLRYAVSLHITWLVNSVAHIWGQRPYDMGIRPCEHTLVVVLANGEGWHNYHHAFPYDYKSNEFGWKINMTTAWIDLCAWLGLVYDRRTVPLDVVKSRIQRTGDGSAYQFKELRHW